MFKKKLQFLKFLSLGFTFALLLIFKLFENAANPIERLNTATISAATVIFLFFIYPPTFILILSLDFLKYNKKI